MELETKRLIIKPLNIQQLSKYILIDNSLENELKLNVGHRVLTERMKKSIQEKIIPKILENPENYMYHTFWTLINKNKKLMVGDVCFKGSPNDKGEIELGYGTYNDFQRNGYMTEAIEEIVLWAFKQKKVRRVIAYTNPNNLASNKILKKK